MGRKNNSNSEDSIVAKLLMNLFFGGSILMLPFCFSSKKSLVEEKTKLLKELAGLNISPEKFDALLTAELDRKLKASFGIWLLFLACLFTAASYLIVVLNSVHKWGISENAITALIIETPIQFIGLLYIIARNLFPQTGPK